MTTSGRDLTSPILALINSESASLEYYELVINISNYFHTRPMVHGWKPYKHVHKPVVIMCDRISSPRYNIYRCCKESNILSETILSNQALSSTTVKVFCQKPCLVRLLYATPYLKCC